MFREIENIGECKLFSRYGRLLGVFDNQRFLKVNDDLTYYEVERGNRVYIYPGDGILDVRDCYKKYDFSKSLVRQIDAYLQGELKNPSKEVLDYIDLYNLNLEKGDYYICPENFREIEKLLLG